MKTIMISPTNKASRRTKNRIREHGPEFEDVTRELTGHDSVAERVCLRGGHGWLGWLPRDEFHIKCVGEKFIKKVLDK